MHRTIEITVSPEATNALGQELKGMEDVVGLTVHHGVSHKPPGDVLIAHVLNRGADKVLQAIERAKKSGPVSVVTSETASVIDPDQEKRVENDVDEAVWEEMETGLRHQGRLTTNFLALMALGGVLAAIGLVSEPAPQAIAFVAAACITPGFEPLAKIPLGVVLGRWHVARRGLLSAVAGYSLLVAAAAATFFVLRATGAASVEDFITNPEVKHIADPSTKEVLVSACGALSGAVILSAYRRSVIVGALIALVIIPAAAMIGVGLMAGQRGLAMEAIQRLLLDVGLIIGLGLVVFWLKQIVVHKRKPLI